jgi:hypothetical protein
MSDLPGHSHYVFSRVALAPWPMTQSPISSVYQTQLTPRDEQQRNNHDNCEDHTTTTHLTHCDNHTTKTTMIVTTMQ